MDKTKEYELLGRVYQSPLSTLKEIIQEHGIVQSGKIEGLDHGSALELVVKWIQKELQSGDQTSIMSVDDTLPKFVILKTEVTPSSTSMKTSSQTVAPPTSGTIEKPVSVFRKDFKVSGQINDSKNGITFVSLIRQIETGVQKGFSELEIVDGVIKCIAPGLQLRDYLEGRCSLDLKSLRWILRSHFQEKSATELYNELGQASQGGSEDPTEFLLRLLSLKQKIQFVSKEAGSEIIYDSKLIDSMFKRTLYTGLREDSIRREIQPLLEREMFVVRDEDLIQKLSVIVAKERERQQKFGRSKARVNSVNTNQNTQNPAENNSQGSVSSELKGLKEELMAEIASLRTMIVTAPSRDNLGPDDTSESSDRKTRALGCRNCQEKGTGRTCKHCWVCGSDEHFKAGCKQRNSGNSRGSQRGGRM